MTVAKGEALKYFDAHMHVPGDHREMEAVMIDLGLKGLNIAFAEENGDRWRSMADFFRGLAHRRPELWAWCTTFPPPDDQSDAAYVSAVVDSLERDFREGAVACKIWKNIGMRVRRYGRYLAVNDPLFDPVWDVIEDAGRPAVLHIADPIESWMPLCDGAPHADYYRSHPEWHMYGRTGVPTHAALIADRDRLLERRDGIAFVGAHLASLEHDMAAVSERLRRYPNFWVDTSARLINLMAGDRDEIRGLFTQHPDRILYGSDLGYTTPMSLMSVEERSASINACRRSLDAHRRFLSHTGEVAVGNHRTRGLDLPPDIVASVMCRNAVRLYGR